MPQFGDCGAVMLFQLVKKGDLEGLWVKRESRKRS